MQTIQTLLSLFPLLFTLTLASQGGLERRQDLSGLPTCAQNCLVTSLASSSGGCSQTDFACLCKSSTFLMASESCYKTSCSDTDTTAAGAWASKTCASIGVEIPTNNASTPVASSSPSSNPSVASASAAVSSASANAHKSDGNKIGLMPMMTVVSLTMSSMVLGYYLV